MATKDVPCCDGAEPNEHRRLLLKSAVGAAALSAIGLPLLGAGGVTYAAALDKATRDSLTPDQIIGLLKQGNERFRSGKMQAHDYLAQKRASATGQYPAAVILGCIDSRAPAEIVFDVGIGEAFNARVAGNVANDDVLGSLEFACALSGAKVVLVMGHTACGAIKGAIDAAKLGNLTQLLKKIEPAVAATTYTGERTSKNAAFVDEVAKTNVLMTVAQIRSQSSVLSALEKQGKVRIVGSMYHLVGGMVEFYEPS